MYSGMLVWKGPKVMANKDYLLSWFLGGSFERSVSVFDGCYGSWKHIEEKEVRGLQCCEQTYFSTFAGGGYSLHFPAQMGPPTMLYEGRDLAGHPGSLGHGCRP
jgi:hypothetical protein